MIEPFTYIHYAPEYIITFVILLSLAIIIKSKILIVVLCIFALALLLFFRRPLSFERTESSASGVIISPADGKILGVKEHQDKGLIQVALFLNVHNVHVQYAPYSGQIVLQTHKDGKFHPAYLFDKSEYNERMETILLTDIGPIILTQIAGLLARRIVSFHEPFDHVKKGEPIGLIKLGSRVDIYLPSNKVQVIPFTNGQRVKIGDPIAKILDLGN